MLHGTMISSSRAVKSLLSAIYGFGQFLNTGAGDL